MKLKYLMPLMFGTAIVLPGCHLYNPVVNNPILPAVNGPISPERTLIDAKILGGLIVLNKNEIAAATIAQQKATSPAVRSYADWMYKAHSEGLQSSLSISNSMGIPPRDGSVALALKKQGAQERATLNRTATGIAFDRTYIGMMVRDHMAALNLIDNELLKIATHPLLVRELHAARAHVAAHLRKAQAIQAELAR